MITLLVASVLAAAPARAGPQLYPVVDPQAPDFGSVVVNGLRQTPDGVESLLSVYTAAGPPQRPAVLGSVVRNGTTLIFKPRFTFMADLDYVAVFDLPTYCARTDCRATAPLQVKFRLPPPPTVEKSRVTAVFPSGSSVPANLLRLYVHFSAPMRRANVDRFIRLLDADGHPIDGPFVVVRQGLWDPQQRRLTLIVHPGRIKRGVGPNMAQGPVLEAGRRYRLVIDAGMPDASGRPLAAAFHRDFTVVPADRQTIDPRGWRVVPPTAPFDDVQLLLTQSLDHALLERLPYIIDANGQRLPGTVTIDRRERRWRFRPSTPWHPGAYRLRVPRILEDLAGNTLDHRFEQTPESPRPSDGHRSAPLTLPFRIDSE